MLFRSTWKWQLRRRRHRAQARASSCTWAQSPCALSCGGRDGFAWKESREAKSLAEPFGLVLSRITCGVGDALSRSGPSPREETLGEKKRSLARENPSRDSPGSESLVLSENRPKNLVGPGRPARGYHNNRGIWGVSSFCFHFLTQYLYLFVVTIRTGTQPIYSQLSQ